MDTVESPFTVLAAGTSEGHFVAGTKKLMTYVDGPEAMEYIDGNEETAPIHIVIGTPNAATIKAATPTMKQNGYGAH